MSSTELLGRILSGPPVGPVTLVSDVSHGVLTLATDGSFTYRPNPGWVGADRFRYALQVGSRSIEAGDVTLDVYGVGQPSPGAQDQFAIGSSNAGRPGSPDITLGSLGPLSFAFEWLIPSFAVSGPGLLILIIAIGAQLLGGSAWLPLVRRELGDFGLGSPRRRLRTARP